MRNETRVTTFEEFARRGGGGGGPGRGEEDGPLSRLWQRWAVRVVGRKVQELETLDRLTPAQFVTLNRLKSEFERVTESPAAACNAVREHSRVFNHPVIKAFLG